MKEQQLPDWMRTRIQPRPASVESPIGQGATWINYGSQYSEYVVLYFPMNGQESALAMQEGLNDAAGIGFEFVSSNHYYELHGKKNFIVVIMGKPVMPPELSELAVRLPNEEYPQS